jgi:hypothetical protein
MTISIEASDVGLRRSDVDDVEGLKLFAVVVDTGTHGGYLAGQTDWRTLAELRDYAQRINDAADWLEAQ